MEEKNIRVLSVKMERKVTEIDLVLKKKIFLKCKAKMKGKRDITIAVDGGVNLTTIKKVYDTGIDITIVGSGLYNANNIKERYSALMKL